MNRPEDMYSAKPQGGSGPVQTGASAGSAGESIGGGRGLVGFGSAQIGAPGAPFAGARPIESAGRFGLPGISIESPGAYTGGKPVGGPSSLFNIGGAPIAILGGVFSGGLPLGGPVTQVFRSGGPVPNTLFISTLEPSGPIGGFFIGSAGSPIGVIIEPGAPIGMFPATAGMPIGIMPAGGMMIGLSGSLHP